MRKEDVIREVMSITGFGFQIAKAIVKLSELPPNEIRKIGRSGRKRPMFSQEAERLVDAARERIRLVDEGG